MFCYINICLILVLFNLLISIVVTNDTLSCKGYNNENVDWFFLYKLPKISDSKNPLIKEGTAYLYMTNKSPEWKLSTNSITSEKSIPGYTLDPFYKDSNSTNNFWFMYNDQPPNKSYSTKYGHAKGVVIFNENQGFWLIHSVPNFPPVPNSGITKGKVEVSESEPMEGKYGYPTSGTNYGQSFLCISVKKAQYNEINQQLLYNEVFIYRQKFPKIKSLIPTISTPATRQKRIRNDPLHRMTRINSFLGSSFTSFAKNAKWKKDLYDDFIAPELNINMYAETWLNGRDKLPSECNETKVMNVKTIRLMNSTEIFFKSSTDHSKWAVQADEGDSKQWICIGDINRAQTQFNRGGGAVCLNHKQIWEQYYTAVYDIEPCPKNKSLSILQKIKSWFG